MAQRVYFDNGPQGAGLSFDNALRVIRADTPDEVLPALLAMEQARAEGHWLAGAASYELGYMFSRKLTDLMPATRDIPLLQFGVFTTPSSKRKAAPTDTATLSAPVPDWTLDDYTTAFNTVKDYIGAGDIYQANLTFPLTCKRTGSLDALYAALDVRLKKLEAQRAEAAEAEAANAEAAARNARSAAEAAASAARRAEGELAARDARAESRIAALEPQLARLAEDRAEADAARAEAEALYTARPDIALLREAEQQAATAETEARNAEANAREARRRTEAALAESLSPLPVRRERSGLRSESIVR